MIQEFVDRFNANRDALATAFAAKHPEDYAEIVKLVVNAVKGNEYAAMDPTRIHKIDDGDYQGTLLFVIGDASYQPSNYWYVMVDYGSCSGCDTFQAIRDASMPDQDYDSPPNARQVSDYMTLALHIVQGLKKMSDD